MSSHRRLISIEIVTSASLNHGDGDKQLLSLVPFFHEPLVREQVA
jgi:hypothetical protein